VDFYCRMVEIASFVGGVIFSLVYRC